MPLNPEQEEVAEHTTGRAWVVSGPGSGKTTTVTERAGRLITSGVAPQNILQITFTNKAANEMRERIEKKYGEFANGMTVMTFHALCVRILKRFGESMGYPRNMVIWDTDDQSSRMAKAMRQRMALSVPSGEDDEEDEGIKKHEINKLCQLVNDWRENLGTDADLRDYVDSGRITEDQQEMIRDYLKRMKAAHAIDFSGLLSETYKLLKGNDEVRTKLQKHFKYIQVDEYQDTNHAQHQIIELLTGEEDNVLAVGDLDQSIFGWRGAKPEGVKVFISNGKHGCKVYKLSENYRSTPEIINCATKLIENDKERTAIAFKANNPSNGLAPVLAGFPNPDEEANAIANKIAAYIGQGVSPKQIAVFYRLNDMSRAIEMALVRRQIPYRVFGGQSFYNRMEVQDCLAMLKLYTNPRDGASFSRIAGRLIVGLGEKTVGAIENYAETHNIDLMAACIQCDQFMPTKTGAQQTKIDRIRKVQSTFSIDKATPPAQSLSELISKLDYLNWLEAHTKEENQLNARKRCIEEMVVDIAKYCQKNEGAGLNDYLDYISLLTTLDTKDEKIDTVSLMSGHACKGLEFDAVFCVGIEDKLLPHDRAVKERPGAGLAEERRLLYVMMTRAKKMLFLSWCKERMRYSGNGLKTVRMKPSPFLGECGLMTMDQLLEEEKNFARDEAAAKRRAEDFDDEQTGQKKTRQQWSRGRRR